MEEFLRRYPPPGQPDPERDEKSEGAGNDRRSPAKLPIEATVDLHGYTVPDGHRALDRFVRNAARQGYRKVLIVHGKGSSPGTMSPLRKMVHEYLERNPSIGATGTPGVKDGGSGATWAIVRQRSR